MLEKPIAKRAGGKLLGSLRRDMYHSVDIGLFGQYFLAPYDGLVEGQGKQSEDSAGYAAKGWRKTYNSPPITRQRGLPSDQAMVREMTFAVLLLG